MQFGFFIQASQMLGRTPGERCGEMFDLIALAESLGFDVAWLATPTWSSATSTPGTSWGDTTIVVPPGWRLRVDPSGFVILEALRHA